MKKNIKKNTNKIITILLFATLLAGQVPPYVALAEVVQVDESSDDELDYILGREMTEEEIEEQKSLEPAYLPEIDLCDMPAPEFSDEPDFGIEEITEIPAKFDLRDAGLITPVKNQNPYGTCWAHGSLASLESYLKKTTDIENDFAESHLVYHTYNVPTGEDELGNCENDSFYFTSSTSRKDILDMGGNQMKAAHTLSNWKGAVDESKYPYSNVLTQEYTAKAYSENSYIMDEMMVAPMKNQKMVKEYLMEIGAGSVNYYSDNSYMNYSTGAYNCYMHYNINHAVTIVGWDDNYSKTNFKHTPSTDGAWIIKNSWGTSWGKDGYFYASYEDVTMNADNSYAYFFTGRAADSKLNNYHYDGGNYPFGTLSTTAIAQVYKVKGNASGAEKLDSIGLYSNTETANYSVQIYKTRGKEISEVTNPKSGTALFEKPQKGKITHVGYNRINLGEDMYFSEGDVISIVVSFDRSISLGADLTTTGTSSGKRYTNTDKSQKGESYVTLSNGAFADLSSVRGIGFDPSNYTPWMNVITEDVAEIPEEFKKKATGIKLDTKSMVLEIVPDGSTEYASKSTGQINYTTLPDSSYYAKVTFTSLDPSVATVTEKGLVEAKKSGLTQISCKANGKEYFCDVAVIDPENCKVETLETIGVLPTVKVSVPAINNFIKQPYTELKITTKSEYPIEKVTLSDNLDSKFGIEKYDDMYMLVPKAPLNATETNLTGTVNVSFAGFKDPVKCDVRINFKNTLPKIKQAKQLTFDINNNNPVEVELLGEYIDLSTTTIASITGDTDSLKTEIVNDRIMASLVGGTTGKQYKITAELKNEAWNGTLPIVISAKGRNGMAKIITSKPGVLLNTSSSKASALLGVKSDLCNVSLNPSDMWQVSKYDSETKSYVAGSPFEISYDADFKYVSISYKDGIIPAQGEYKLRLSNVLAGYADVTKDIKVKVTSAMPVAQMKISGGVNLVNRDRSSFAGKVTLKNTSAGVSNIEVKNDDYYIIWQSGESFLLGLKNDAKATDTGAITTKKANVVQTIITLTDGTTVSGAARVKPKQKLQAIKINPVELSPASGNTAVKVNVQSLLPSGYIIESIETPMATGGLMSGSSKAGLDEAILITVTTPTIKTGKRNIKLKVYLKGAEVISRTGKSKPFNITIPVAVK